MTRSAPPRFLEAVVFVVVFVFEDGFVLIFDLVSWWWENGLLLPRRPLLRRCF